MAQQTYTKEHIIVNTTPFEVIVSATAERQLITHFKRSDSNSGESCHRNRSFSDTSQINNEYRNDMKQNNNSMNIKGDIGAGAAGALNTTVAIASKIAGSLAVNAGHWAGGAGGKVSGSSENSSAISNSMNLSGNGMLGIGFNKTNENKENNIKENNNSLNNIYENNIINENKFAKNNFLEQTTEYEKIKLNATSIQPYSTLPFAVCVNNSQSLVYFTIYQMIDYCNAYALNTYNNNNNNNNNNNSYEQECLVKGSKIVPKMICQHFGLNRKFLVLTMNSGMGDKNGITINATADYNGIFSENINEDNRNKDKFINNDDCRFSLSYVNLERFYDEFISNGWNDVNTWDQLTDNDLIEMGFKRGHLVTFKKYMKERKEQIEIEKKLPAPPPSSSSSSSYASNIYNNNSINNNSASKPYYDDDDDNGGRCNLVCGGCSSKLVRYKVEYIRCKPKNGVIKCNLCENKIQGKETIVYHCNNYKMNDFVNNHKYGWNVCQNCKTANENAF